MAHEHSWRGGSLPLSDLAIAECEDSCEFLCFGTEPWSDNEAGRVALEMNEFLRSQSAGVLWQREEPKAFRATRGEENCVRGLCGYGDNVEDEWLLTAFLVRFSEQHPTILLSVRDSSDGEFLLIEAADVIPEDLHPGNGDYRVWILAGEVHIVHDLKCGFQTERGLSIEQAVAELRSAVSFRASEAVQMVVQSRIRGLPEKALEEMHCVCALLPKRFALALTFFPQLLSRAVAVLQYERQELNAFVKKLKGEKRRALLSEKSAVPEIGDEIVPVMIRFTRFLYAQLLHVPFLPDYAALYQVIQSAQLELGLTEDRPNAARIGMRLCCALDFMRDSEWSPEVEEATTAALKSTEQDLRTRLPEVDTFPPDSSESWLDVSAEQLEELFAGDESRFDQTKQEEATVLEQFLNSTSGLDGIDFDTFDAEKFFNILGQENEDEEEEEDSADESDLAAVHEGDADGIPTAFEAEYGDVLQRELSANENLLPVMNSTDGVHESDSTRPLDLDVDLVKQFLESARGQKAGSGAATNLFRELGIPFVPSNELG